MSKSLAIVNGDFLIGSGRGFSLVSGRSKLLQDLRLWVLERMGIDPSTPTFGNLLDGGIQNGVNIDGFIGQIMTDDAINNIRNTIIDLLQRYQTMQFEKIRSETLRYLGENTLDEDEILESIDSVIVQNLGTTALVQVRLSTLAGSQIKLTVPVPDGALA
jgi:hypothetical protein